MHVRLLFSHISVVNSLLALHAVTATPIVKRQNAATNNANYIFNAIHSSMRQWGSSLNHNGMSFFMATVPEGTQLYHGSASKEVVRGMEWLAFEPEHALIFARPRGPPGGRRPGHHDGDKAEKKEQRGFRDVMGFENEDECDVRIDPWSRQGHAHMPAPAEKMHGPPHPPPRYHGGPPDDTSVRPEGQHALPWHHDKQPPPPPPSHDDQGQHPPPHHEPPSNPPSSAKGYLHTYIPTRPLRLLYIDGLSAGKTSNGTLDSQDILLLNMTAPPGSPMGGETARARGMCDLASSIWENNIDGILRMEAGFEIILCDFDGAVRRKSVVMYEGGRDERPGGGEGRGGVMGGWRYIKAVSERYHGIGGERVRLDYEKFVSVFAFDGEGERGMRLWDNDVVSDTLHPRLVNASPEQLGQVRDAITAMILESSRMEEGRNWQAVADMVVQRYSGAIHYLHTDESVRRSKEAFAAYLTALLRPFVSPTARNTTLEIKRCTAQFVPPSRHHPKQVLSLAHSTVHTVATHICNTLVEALDASTLKLSYSLAATSSPAYHALDLIDGLADYLQWTTWKECGSCADEEVCFVPIWPMGSLENHRNPQCVKEDGVGMGYWGYFGPPPGGDDPGLKSGARRHGRYCAPRRHGASLAHAPDYVSNHHDRGGWDWGVWSQLRVGLIRMVEWFDSRPEPQSVEIKVNFVDTP